VLTETWDGLPVSRERPYGASVLVWRRRGGRIEWLLLHRGHQGPAYEGEWAWGPPAGARLPDERVEECARRELLEEAGLELPLADTPCGTDDWAVYAAELGADEPVALSPEHDRHEWASASEAARRCLPRAVADAFRCAERLVAAEAGD
jgi:8-oxo-dGTP pyrophosphatase MutT (NUDIX family)